MHPFVSDHIHRQRRSRKSRGLRLGDDMQQKLWQPSRGDISVTPSGGKDFVKSRLKDSFARQEIRVQTAQQLHSNTKRTELVRNTDY
ncbi:hypothetical protein WAI453_001624 [Rhynchosporium graminicola]